MKYKSIALPKPDLGIDYSKVESILVPDQSLSLQDILKRFTRGEAVPVGHETHYESGAEKFDVDIEKMAYADITEKKEFSKMLQGVRKEYDRQMAEKAKAEKIKAEADAKRVQERKIKRAAERLAKEKSKTSA